MDVSLSKVIGRVEPVYGLKVPSQQVRLNYTLNVQNNCPETISDVKYQVDVTGGCPDLSMFFYPPESSDTSVQYFNADQKTLAPGSIASVQAGQDASIATSCTAYNGTYGFSSTIAPASLSVGFYASGTDLTTNSQVHSQEKYLTVLGSSPWVEKCDQACAPATGTAGTDATSVVFVHGIQLSAQKGKNSGHDCNTYWGDAVNFLRERGIRDLRTIKYYNGDKNCVNGDEMRYSSDLHHSLYNSSCPAYHLGAEGTNDESIYRLSCLLAQYLHHNFGLQDRKVVLVGHSLGGMIIRTTMYQMQEYAGRDDFPPTIGHVTKAITFNSPHNGANYVYANAACGGCAQGQELWAGSDLIGALTTSGRNPQTSEGFTEWTTIGSQCDPVVIPAQSSVGMDASHAVVYSGIAKVTPTCYDHGEALHDFKTDHDSEYYCCDTSNPGTNPCGSEYRSKKNSRWRETRTGLHGLDLLYTEVTKGLTCSARRMRPRLWMAATLASAWALLAR